MKTMKLLKEIYMCVHNEGDKDNENNDVKIMLKTAINQDGEC